MDDIEAVIVMVLAVSVLFTLMLFAAVHQAYEHEEQKKKNHAEMLAAIEQIKSEIDDIRETLV